MNPCVSTRSPRSPRPHSLVTPTEARTWSGRSARCAAARSAARCGAVRGAASAQRGSVARVAPGHLRQRRRRQAHHVGRRPNKPALDVATTAAAFGEPDYLTTTAEDPDPPCSTRSSPTMPRAASFQVRDADVARTDPKTRVLIRDAAMGDTVASNPAPNRGTATSSCASTACTSPTTERSKAAQGLHRLGRGSTAATPSSRTRTAGRRLRRAVPPPGSTSTEGIAMSFAVTRRNFLQIVKDRRGRRRPTRGRGAHPHRAPTHPAARSSSCSRTWKPGGIGPRPRSGDSTDAR